MDYAYKPTTHGRAVMAACMALERPFHITRVVFGSGKVPENVNLADVHELLEYVSDGAVADRRHEDDRFYLTIQYANSVHPEVKTFLLSEFIVFVEDPVNGGETDLLYGTLGDYRQPVPAYNPAFPPSVFNFPLTLILSDEINVSVSAPAGLVTYDELVDLLNSRAAGAAKLDITIPISGWVEDQDTKGTYPVHLDIASTDITEAMVPILTVLPGALAEAGACGLCPVSRTLPGALRLYAKSIPAAAISASLTLLDTAPQHSGLASSAATAKLEITIPASGWEEDTDTNGEYPMHFDVHSEQVQENLIPMLIMYPECLEAAGKCGMSPYSRTMPGVLRVYARQLPEAEINASLALLGVTQGMIGGTTGGAVKVKPGSGLAIDSDGYLVLDAASGEDVARLFSGSNG